MSDDASQLKRALLAVRDLRARLETVERARTTPIAIIGMACRFPGGADSPAAFWRLLADGRDAIVETPPDRWDVDALYDADPDAGGRVATRWGGFLAEVDRFDPYFFGISPREAEGMDPQQRLLLEVSAEAFESAGQTRERLAGSATGVFVGVHSHSHDYYALQADDPAALDVYSGTGTAHNVLGGRIAYIWDLLGPNLAVDTACSSSLVAVHLAVQSLRAGECRMALAGGVNVMLTPHFTIAASRMRMLAADGRCKAFDARADGFVRGEGCGAVILKRLDDALADGDPVLAVVRGTAINQDGHTNGLTAPSGLAQQAVLRAALDNAGVDAPEVEYVETHGTGTPLGDPIEVEALSTVIGARNAGAAPCLLGSVKTNIGHLEGAAGIAGLIKAVLVVRERLVPGTLHFTALNPNIDLSRSRLSIASSATPWTSHRRIAGVSSFGWSGTNAHVVIEAPPDVAPPDDSAHIPERVDLLPLSARTPQALAAVARSYAEYLAADDRRALRDVCGTAAMFRTHHQHRAAITASSRGVMIDSLRGLAAGETRPGLATGRAERRPGIVFIFPGQGSQWLGMGRRLLEAEPVFREAIEACDAALAREVGWSLAAELLADAARARLDRIDVVQPVLWGVQVALAALWRSWGIEPDAVVGHSMGEVAAASIAGVLTLDDAARVISRRSRLLRRVSGSGAMAVTELTLDEARDALRGHEAHVSVAACNGPRSTLLSGAPASLAVIVDDLQSRGVFCRHVQVDVASHSPQMDPLLDELRSLLAEIQPHSGRVPIYSTVTGLQSDGSSWGREYWADNLRSPVLLWPAVRRAAGDGHDLFVEVSPHPILGPAITGGFDHLGLTTAVVPSLERDADDLSAMRASLGALYTAGARIDWARVMGRHPFRRLPDLPSYPWQRERCWLRADTSTPARIGPRAAARAGTHPLLGERVEIAGASDSIAWATALDRREVPSVHDHLLHGRRVVSASTWIALAFAAAADAWPGRGVDLEDLVFERPLAFEDERDTAEVQTVLRPSQDGGTVEMYGRTGHRWVRFAHARLHRAALDPVERIAPAGRDIQWEPAAPIYDRLSTVGVELRGSLRRLTRVRTAGTVAEAEVSLPAPLPRDHRLPPLGPALLDPCLQLTAALLPPHEGAFHVPSSVTRVRLRLPPLDELPRTLTAAAKRRDPFSAGPVVDLTLADPAGRVLVSIEGVRFTVSGATDAASPDVERWFHERRWVSRPLEHSGNASATGEWILLADTAGLSAAVARQLGAHGADRVHVIQGSAADATSGAEGLAESPLQARLRNVLTEIAARGDACRGIVSLSAVEAALVEDAPSAALERAVERGLEPLLAIVRARTESAAEGTRVWVATRGAQRVEGDNATGLVRGLPQSALWGFGRAIAEEHGEWWGGLVDLDPGADNETSAAAIVHELVTNADGGEPEVAWRRSTRFLARLAPATPSADAYRWRTDATYLVTGGFGGVGRDVVRWMAAQGARHIVVLGRTPLPPRAQWSAPLPARAAAIVDGIRSLESAGVAIRYESVDVADESALGAFLTSFRNEQWPPFAGVIHAASTVDGTLAAHTSGRHTLDAGRAKMLGAWLLHRLLGDVDFFVLFSSIAALVPLAGQASYAAANAFLDALADLRRTTGRPAVSIGWGIWKNRGRIHETTRGARGVDQLGEQGVHQLPPALALDALGRVLTASAGALVTASADWSRLRTVRRRPLLEDLAAPRDVRSTSDDGASPRARILQASADGRAALVQQVVIETLARVLRVPAARLDPHAPLGSFGMDSLTAVELRNRLEAAFELRLSATLVWNHPTAASLASHLGSKLGIASAEPRDASPAAREPHAARLHEGAAAEVETMSEEDALRALLDRRTRTSS